MPKLEPYILFTVADTTYGVLSDHIQQMEMIEQITRVPNVPAFVDGIVYLRGKVLPVVNLRVRFGLERIPYDLHARLIVVQMGERLVGMIRRGSSSVWTVSRSNPRRPLCRRQATALWRE